MYIRKVNKSTAKAERYVYRLCESYRTANGPRQRNILTLQDFDFPKAQWKDLADAIEAELTGQSDFFTTSEIQSLAQHYAALIQEKRLSEQRNLRQAAKQTEYETVDIDSIKPRNIRTIGAEYVALSAYRELQLDVLFQELGFTEYQQKAAALSIIGRLVQPGSESSTQEWAVSISGLGHLLNCSFDQLANNTLYRIADTIYSHKETIENHLQKREKDLFNLQENIVLYDLTNTYFEGKMLSNPKAAFGRSKEKRTDCKLMTLGLIIDEAGFPKRSKVMEGNQSEPKSLIGMIALLENKTIAEFKISKGIKKHKTIVMDAGIATKENLILLQEYGYDYICVARTAPIPESMIARENLKKIKETRKNSIEVQLFENDTENILYCKSFLKHEKERSMLKKFKAKLEKELCHAREALHKKSGTKNYDKVVERIGRIKERNKSIARFYHIRIEREKDIATDIRWEYTNTAKLDFKFSGSYFLKTSRKDLDESQLWHLYVTLNMVESAFRSLKSELAFRPVYHQKAERAESHLFIAVLAYHLLNTIRTRLLEKDIHMSWKKLRRLLNSHSLVTTSMQTKTGKTILIQQASEADYFQSEIYKALGLKKCPFRKVITKS